MAVSDLVTPPTNELGAVMPQGLFGSWAGFIDLKEQTPELAWPQSITTFDQMTNDSQVDGLLRSMYMPLGQYKWSIKPGDCPLEAATVLAQDLGLPLFGEKEARRPIRNKGRFNHREHLRLTCRTALKNGHMGYEQVAEDDGTWTHLKKLAPRMPGTITKINVERDGGLRSVEQAGLGTLTPVTIPVNRLVWFPHDMEPGAWIGRSMLRSMYGPFLIKQTVMRLGAVNIERGGGLPIVEGAPGMNRGALQALDKLAQRFRPGRNSGGAVPNGTKLTLVGTNTTDQAERYIRLMNEEMARASLQMFMQLGQTDSGSRSLGESFIDYFRLAQIGLAEWYCEIMNCHVIEDWVDWNLGPDVPAPQLVFEATTDPNLSIAELVSLITAGVIQVDDELEHWIRSKFSMPDLSGEARSSGIIVPRGTETPANRLQHASDPLLRPRGASRERAEARLARLRDFAPQNVVKLPARELRRRPTDFELRSMTNFADIDERFETTLAELVAAWKSDVWPDQIDELVAQIAETDDLQKLANLTATPGGEELLAGTLTDVIEAAAKNHIAEAKAQGKTIPMPDLSELYNAAQASAAALDNILADAIALSAGKKAIGTLGGSLTSADVAPIVRDFLENLEGQEITDTLTGAIHAAETDGRAIVMETGSAEELYSSEILDKNTCKPCSSKDGEQYESMSAARADYPSGGFVGCQGGGKCRGTLVAVYDEETP